MSSNNFSGSIDYLCPKDNSLFNTDQDLQTVANKYLRTKYGLRYLPHQNEIRFELFCYGKITFHKDLCRILIDWRELSPQTNLIELFTFALSPFSEKVNHPSLMMVESTYKEDDNNYHSCQIITSKLKF